MMASVAPEDAGAGADTTDRCGGDTYWYPEWDHRSQDYLRRHVRIRARTSIFSQTGVYGEVLHRRSSLVGSIRRAFERIRPQGVSILRRWMEGDDFDYRALLDFTVDRRMGRFPSQRIYIKRLKQRRDVAAMLLVDMSRSTAHPARGTGQSVMDVEKEAIVLFCEALGVLGDRFAVSGYSGAGRMGVEYFRIKGFDETMAPDVRARIGGMRPMRSTRTGAAIRHAAGELEAVDAGVRLLVVLGDGFPNDVDYKKAHAIEDTRKAVLEAHARRIHTHGITVNMVGDPGLDALFGATAHTVITDVRELPEKLWRVYSSLTKQ
jgi:nitric oxide reductase activation protein